MSEENSPSEITMSELGDKSHYINCFLADKGVRAGYLFQTVDLGEYDSSAPKSAARLSYAAKYFPGLRQLACRQGVLLSREEFSLDRADDDVELGKILGFPCEMPDKSSSKETTYAFHLRAVFPPKALFSTKAGVLCAEEYLALPEGASKEDVAAHTMSKILWEEPDCRDKYYKSPILSFVSADTTCVPAAEALRAKIERCLLNSADFLLRDSMHGVEMETVVCHSSKDLIAALLDLAHVFVDSELDEISNVWGNNVGENHQHVFDRILYDPSRLQNPVVRGMIIAMLLDSENKTEAVFYPLQNHGPAIMAKYEEINDAHEERMVQIMLEALAEA
jgi:hypothetical protein